MDGWPSRDGRTALDDMLTALAAAPSVHNTQPWLVHVAPGHIDIHPDRSRLLPVLDPTGRELGISVGAAVFNLRAGMLAHGRTPVLAVLTSADGLPAAARVTPGQPRPPTLTARLFAWAIPRRHSNRQPYSPKPVRIEVLDELRAAAAAEGARLVIATPERRRLIFDLTRVAERRQRRNTAYRRELAEWTGDRSDRFDGVPAEAIGPRSTHDTVPLRDFATTHHGRRLPTARFEADPTVAVLYTNGDGAADWLRAGQALQRVLLTATLRQVTGSLISQPLEMPESRAMLAFGDWSAQMVLRLGYAPQGPPSPRRPPELFLAEPPISGAPWLGVTPDAGRSTPRVRRPAVPDRG
jgi:hypothetical protein